MPHIKLKKMKNCRDLSHITTMDGKKIKQKTLIRSEALFNASKKDISVLTKKYGLKTVVDFRTDVECLQKPDPNISQVKYFHDPVLEAETLGITREKVDYKDMPKIFKGMTGSPMEYMKTMYRALVLEESAREHYKNFFDILLSQDGAFLWHCTAGKDRVGVGTALLLYALGVDRESIIEDYLMTGYYYRFENAKLRFLIKIAIRDKNVKNYLDHLLSVKKEYICASFDAVEEVYGSIDLYLKTQMGLDNGRILSLRNKFLE